MNEILALYQEAARGNTNALVFLLAFHTYAHSIDDLVDGDVPVTPESLLAVLMQANQLYSTPFYLAYSSQLAIIIADITNCYADSVAWEKADEPWKRQVADVIRQCGNRMVTTVAYLVGGFQHSRNISLRLREMAYHSQHS